MNEEVIIIITLLIISVLLLSSIDQTFLLSDFFGWLFGKPTRSGGASSNLPVEVKPEVKVPETRVIQVVQNSSCNENYYRDLYSKEKTYTDWLRVQKDECYKVFDEYAAAYKYNTPTPCSFKNDDWTACRQGCTRTLYCTRSMANLFNCYSILGFQDVYSEDSIHPGDIIAIDIPSSQRNNFENSPGFLIHSVLKKENGKITTFGYTTGRPDNLNTTIRDVIGKLCSIRYYGG